MESLGALTARALRGAWRAQPSRSTLSPADLRRVTPHLLATGAAGLGWWVTRADPELSATPEAEQLADGHRIALLHNLAYQQRLETVLALCADHDVEPLLVKGWTLGRRYPERGLRPYGDVDLVVAAEDHHRLQAALDARPHDRHWVDVDLEHAFLAADRTPRARLIEASREADLDGRPVRILGREDELRLTCIHFLRAGGWRALNLCDVALLLETEPDGLDWDRVLGAPGDRRRNWVAVAAALAADLLGADLTATPLAGAEAPAWVRDHVLAGFAMTPHDRAPAPRFHAAGPVDLARQVRARRPDVLELAVYHRRRLGRARPRHLPFWDLAYRTAALITPLRSRRAPRSGYVEVAR